MSKLKKKIRRSYKDFFSHDDIFEPSGPKVHLSITDLDARGHLINPKAPCVVTSIDPHYTEDANRQRKFSKFNVKSDILRLREITRTKFILYVTQQRAIKKEHEQRIQTTIYEQTKDFMESAQEELNAVERESFGDMIAANKFLKELKRDNKSDEMKEWVLQHQKLAMEIKDVHKKFIFLLNLIGYFDTSEGAIDILKLNKLTDAADFVFLKSDFHPEDITTVEVKHLKEFLTDVVNPYLSKQNYLNADLWIDGYENTRRKLFGYYNQFTRLALLNHIVSIIHDKFIKSHNRRISKPIVNKTSVYLTDRKNRLQSRANEVLTDFEQKQTKRKIYWHIEGVAPVQLEKIQHKDNRENKTDKATAISKLEDIHTVLMGLLNELDKLEPDFCRRVEEEVRSSVSRQKKTSRKVLIKENRFLNWIKHYHKH